MTRLPRSMTWKSDTTMSTSDVDRLALTPDRPQSGVSSLPVGGFPGAGLPDPLMLARMANEFFTALPGGLPVASLQAASSLPVESPANISVISSLPAAAPEVSLPSDPHFTTVPASAGAVSPHPATAPVHVGPPAVPGPAGSATQGTGSDSSIPTFSFLEDARPIFSDTRTTPQSPYPPAKPMSGSAPAPTGST